MNMKNLIVIATAAGIACTASASIVTLTPDQINGGDTNNGVFDNGDVIMRALIGGSTATFNANAARLGIDDQGTNANAFNDPDTDPNNGNEEMLEMAFSANAGLTQLSWDFSRAANVEISGFLADPGASFSGRNFDPNGVLPDLSSTYDALTGTLSFALPFNIAFGGDDGFLDLANAAASAGATLTLKVTDPDEAGAQLAITSISYDSAVPAPAGAALLAGAGLVAMRRRR
jgi:hypothetical protein